jgi:hypothetical protein
MLSWTIQITIISLIFIILLHHLFQFFKNTLTVPKIKDLVNAPNKKYQNIINHIEYKNHLREPNILPSESKENMKNELKNFLKTQNSVIQTSNGLGANSSIDFSVF